MADDHHRHGAADPSHSQHMLSIVSIPMIALAVLVHAVKINAGFLQPAVRPFSIERLLFQPQNASIKRQCRSSNAITCSTDRIDRYCPSRLIRKSNLLSDHWMLRPVSCAANSTPSVAQLVIPRPIICCGRLRLTTVWCRRICRVTRQLGRRSCGGRRRCVSSAWCRRSVQIFARRRGVVSAVAAVRPIRR